MGWLGAHWGGLDGESWKVFDLETHLGMGQHVIVDAEAGLASLGELQRS